MGKTKFTVRVDSEAFIVAKQYAGEHGTTVTNLVEEYFRSLGRVNDTPTETPILNELAGSLSPDTSLEDYRAYLEGKYLASPRTDR
jgi:hypothetical protein